jgi:hypothetical protein
MPERAPAQRLTGILRKAERAVFTRVRVSPG